MVGRCNGSGVPTATGVRPRTCSAGGCTVRVYPWTRKMEGANSAVEYLNGGDPRAGAYLEERGITVDAVPSDLATMRWLGAVRVVVDPTRDVAEVSARVRGRWRTVAVIREHRTSGPGRIGPQDEIEARLHASGDGEPVRFGREETRE